MTDDGFVWSWTPGSSYDTASRHVPTPINDYTSTKRFVCLQCSQEQDYFSFPDDGMDWPCLEAQQLIENGQWDAILLGITTTQSLWRDGSDD